MTSSLEAFPECWQPLNWSRFEESLQELVLGQENLALNARVCYLNIALDCLEASRHRRQQHPNFGSGGSNSGGGGGGRAAAQPPLPQLFLGAGGDRDGRTAVKRCSHWAAKVWAHRHTSVTSSSGGGGGGGGSAKGISDSNTNARVCMAVSRALGEALEAFQMAGGAGGGGGDGGGSLPKELEGCQLVAVGLESNAEVAEAEATAKCRAGLMRSLAGRPFCPTLAGVLLQNMPAQEETKGGVEVERLKALLRRQQARGVSGGGGGGGGGEKVRRGPRVGAAKVVQSGSAMLLADMDTDA